MSRRTPAANSRASSLNSATIINVDSVQTWNAAYNGGAQQGTFYPGRHVFVRATVSDPFGSFDISARAHQHHRCRPGTHAGDQPAHDGAGRAGELQLATAATCMFQYQYTVPRVDPALGSWTIRVHGNEGVEGVFDLGVGTFVVALPQPSITMVKSSVRAFVSGGGQSQAHPAVRWCATTSPSRTAVPAPSMPTRW